MINKMGININKDEAMVLMASADQNYDGVLDLKEFHDLIYSANEALNVDLGSIEIGASE
jgi:Ca2+-binding EF-hand superfamily protein